MGGFSTDLTVGSSAALDAMDLQQPNDDGNKVSGAARDFEALLLGQILRSVHEEGGWLGSDEDDAGEAAVGLGEEQLARTMAASGGLGLHKLIEAGLRNQQDQANSVSLPRRVPARNAEVPGR